MEYTVQKLGSLAGISPRTLRYYDEIGILKPARINSSGYRIYGEKEVDQLQQVLFYRELGLSLEQIKEIITSPNFDGSKALNQHREKLLEKRNQLDILIANVEKTLALREGRIYMSDKEKFEGFKQKLIDDNEKQYGKEIREKYGEDAVNQSNQNFKNMSKADYDRMTKLGEEIINTLAEAVKEGNPTSDLGQKVAGLHKEWISLAWGHYSKEVHAGLVQMYVDDERFTAYYDKTTPGAAQYLRDAVHAFVNNPTTS